MNSYHYCRGCGEQLPLALWGQLPYEFDYPFRRMLCSYAGLPATCAMKALRWVAKNRPDLVEQFRSKDQEAVSVVIDMWLEAGMHD